MYRYHRTMSSNTKVVGYIRVSTSEQATEGVSLDAQRAKLEAYAVAMDLDLVAIHVDAGVSAKSLDRDGLKAALADLDNDRADGLLICKLDRLTRSVVDLGSLLDRYFATRYSLVSVADSIDTRTAAGRLCLNLLVSVSQWEREAIGERTRDALAHLKQQGVRIGAPAMGWNYTTARDANGHSVVEQCSVERATIARARELRAEGLSLAAIGNALHAEGRAPKRGKVWHRKTVSRLLAA